MTGKGYKAIIAQGGHACVRHIGCQDMYTVQVDSACSTVNWRCAPLVLAVDCCTCCFKTVLSNLCVVVLLGMFVHHLHLCYFPVAQPSVQLAPPGRQLDDRDRLLPFVTCLKLYGGSTEWQQILPQEPEQNLNDRLCQTLLDNVRLELLLCIPLTTYAQEYALRVCCDGHSCFMYLPPVQLEV